MLRKLKAIYDSRESFYGKAKVDVNNGKAHLLSYNDNVAIAGAPIRARFNPSTRGFVYTSSKPTIPKVLYKHLFLAPDWDYSQTTHRHVKEFIMQYMADSWFKANGLYNNHGIIEPSVPLLRKIAKHQSKIALQNA